MTAPFLSLVSAREAEVLALVGSRLSNAEIARELVISVRTVESHVASLLRKCGAADRRELAALSAAGMVRGGVEEPPASRRGGVVGLPSPRTSFVGRRAERRLVAVALDGSRLLTLVGPGGVGKTRLAVEVAAAVAERFPAGAAFVDLVAVREGFVAAAVAAVLAVPPLPPGPQQPLVEEVAGRLGAGGWLLVLDNCEHLVEEVSGFADRVLSACPGVTLVATSRERLGLPGERVVPVGPLPLGSDAEALFRVRAGEVDAAFAADSSIVSEVCARLDGLPLAIELAAARTASLGMHDLLAALPERLRLLSGSRTADRRHRSLRALLDWSYELLDGEERALFRRLGVFAGPFDLAAAVAVTGCGTAAAVADLLGRLADKSLIVRVRDAGRWRLLETLRGYALDRLTAEELAGLQARHRDWAAAVVAGLEDRLVGGREEWQEDFDAVADDLRSALSTATGPDVVPHRLARALGHLTFARRFRAEAVDHYLRAAELAPGPAESTGDLRMAAACAHVVAHSDQAVELLLVAAERAVDGNVAAITLAQAVEMVHRFPAFRTQPVPPERLRGMLATARTVGDPTDPAVAAALALATAWNTDTGSARPDPALAARAVEAAEATGDPVMVSAALDVVGSAANNAGQIRAAHRLCERRLALAASMDDHDPHQAVEIEDAFYVAYVTAIVRGDPRAAMTAAGRDLRGELLDNRPYVSAGKLIPGLVLSGNLAEAVRDAAVMWEGWERAGKPPAAWMSPIASAAALAHGLLGDQASFATWRGRAAELAGPARPVYLAAFETFVDARIATHLGLLEGATTIVARAFTDQPYRQYQPYAHAAAAELAVVAGLDTAADLLTTAGAAAEENMWAAACLDRAAVCLHTDIDALTTSANTWARIGARAEHALTLLLIPGRETDARDQLATLGITPRPAQTAQPTP